MKNFIIKALIPPILFFIIYFNLNFFVFSFAARNNFLVKSLEDVNSEISSLQNELKLITKDPKLKLHSELLTKIKSLGEHKESEVDSSKLKKINLYQAFKDHNLLLITEQPAKSKNTKEEKAISHYVLQGDFQDVIRLINSFNASIYIPVAINISTAPGEKTLYTVSIWNKNV